MRRHRFSGFKPVTAAARFIYLSKTCWGGIFRVNKNGQFNVPFGGSERTICRKENLLACVKIFEKAEITCSDFEPIIDKVGEGDVVYADPPYTSIGQNNGFIRYNERLFAWKDQERLAAACKRASERIAVIIVSGLWHESLLDLYSNWNAFRLERISRISAKKEGRGKEFEVLFLNIK